MTQKRGSITIWLAFSMILLSSGLVSHVMAIPIILGVAKRDSWVSVLIATPVFLVWVALLYSIIRQIRGQRLIDWLEREFGRLPSWLVRFSAAAVLFISAAYTLHDTSMWTVATYMQQTPIFVIALTAVVIALLAAYGGIRTIAISSSILLPFVMLLGYFVMGANTKYKKYELLFPIAENGWGPAFSGSVYVLAALLETWILLLYQHELRQRLKWWQLMLLGLFLISMTIGPTIGAITEFGPLEAAKQRHTAFEQWKILSLGRLMQHVDFLSIYQWLCGSFARVSLSLYLIVDLFNIRKPRSRAIALAVVGVTMFIIARHMWRDDQTLQYLQYIHMPAILIYASGLTVLLAIGAFIYSKRKEKRSKDDTSSPSRPG